MKNGSNILGSTSGAIPTPVSVIAKATNSPSSPSTPSVALQDDVHCREHDDAAARHRVTRVDRDVDQRQLKLRDIDFDRPDIRRDLALELNVAAQRPEQHFMHAFDPLFHVGNDRIERLAARESQQLAGQAFSTMGGRVDGIDPLQIFGIGKPPAQKLRMAADDHQ